MYVNLQAIRSPDSGRKFPIPWERLVRIWPAQPLAEASRVSDMHVTVCQDIDELWGFKGGQDDHHLALFSWKAQPEISSEYSPDSQHSKGPRFDFCKELPSQPRQAHEELQRNLFIPARHLPQWYTKSALSFTAGLLLSYGLTFKVLPIRNLECIHWSSFKYKLWLFDCSRHAKPMQGRITSMTGASLCHTKQVCMIVKKRCSSSARNATMRYSQGSVGDIYSAAKCEADPGRNFTFYYNLSACHWKVSIIAWLPGLAAANGKSSTLWESSDSPQIIRKSLRISTAGLQTLVKKVQARPWRTRNTWVHLRHHKFCMILLLTAVEAR